MWLYYNQSFGRPAAGVTLMNKSSWKKSLMPLLTHFLACRKVKIDLMTEWRALAAAMEHDDMKMGNVLKVIWQQHNVSWLYKKAGEHAESLFCFTARVLEAEGGQ